MLLTEDGDPSGSIPLPIGLGAENTVSTRTSFGKHHVLNNRDICDSSKNVSNDVHPIADTRPIFGGSSEISLSFSQ